MKNVLKPNGKIIILQYYGVSPLFIRSVIQLQNDKGLLALPYTRQISDGKTLPFTDDGANLIKKDQLLSQSIEGKFLSGFIDIDFKGIAKEKFLNANANAYTSICVDQRNEFIRIANAFEKAKGVATRNPLLKGVNVGQFTFMTAFTKTVSTYAEQSGFTSNVEMHKEYISQIADGNKPSTIFCYGHVMNFEHSHKKDLVERGLKYTVVTLKPKDN